MCGHQLCRSYRAKPPLGSPKIEIFFQNAVTMGYNIHAEAPPNAFQIRKNNKKVKAALLVAMVEDVKWSKLRASVNLANVHFVSL